VTITSSAAAASRNELHDGDVNVALPRRAGVARPLRLQGLRQQDLADKPWATETPDFTGQVPIYSGISFAPLTFNFPVRRRHEVRRLNLRGRLRRWIPQDRPVQVKVGPDWDMTELY
jgi:hypothetical protein